MPCARDLQRNAPLPVSRRCSGSHPAAPGRCLSAGLASALVAPRHRERHLIGLRPLSMIRPDLWQLAAGFRAENLMGQLGPDRQRYRGTVEPWQCGTVGRAPTSASLAKRSSSAFLLP